MNGKASVNLTLDRISELERYLCEGSMGNAEILNKDLHSLLTSLADIVAKHLGFALDMKRLGGTPAALIVAKSVIYETYAKLRDGHVIADDTVALLSRLASENHARDEFGWNTDKWKHPSLLRNWADPSWEQEIRRIITEAMAKEDLPFPITFLQSTSRHQKKLQEATAILDAIAPLLAAHTISLIDAFAVVKAPFTSAYNNEAPGMFIVDEAELDDALTFADTLVHEALHEKMAVIRVTHHLLREGYNDLDSEARGHVRLPWPNCDARPRHFSVARALATYHYYAHSALLMAAMFVSQEYRRSRHEAADILSRFDRAFGRARYLKDALGQAQCGEQLGADGSGFLAWLEPVVVTLEENFLGSRALSNAWK